MHCAHQRFEVQGDSCQPRSKTASQLRNSLLRPEHFSRPTPSLGHQSKSLFGAKAQTMLRCLTRWIASRNLPRQNVPKCGDASDSTTDSAGLAGQRSSGAADLAQRMNGRTTPSNRSSSHPIWVCSRSASGWLPPQSWPMVLPRFRTSTSRTCTAATVLPVSSFLNLEQDQTWLQYL